MNLQITETAKRILKEDTVLDRTIYRALNDIEIVLDQSYFQGNVILDEEGKGLWLNICPTRYANNFEAIDLCDQLTYLIKCNHELNLPLSYSGEQFSSKFL